MKNVLKKLMIVLAKINKLHKYVPMIFYNQYLATWTLCNEGNTAVQYYICTP